MAVEEGGVTAALVGGLRTACSPLLRELSWSAVAATRAERICGDAQQ